MMQPMSHLPACHVFGCACLPRDGHAEAVCCPTPKEMIQLSLTYMPVVSLVWPGHQRDDIILSHLHFCHLFGWARAAGKLFVVFAAEADPETGQSWCPDCTAVLAPVRL